MPHPIYTSRIQPDGCYEVFLHDRLIGWVRRINIASAYKPKSMWRALTVDGELRHERSLASARDALVEMTH